MANRSPESIADEMADAAEQIAEAVYRNMASGLIGITEINLANSLMVAVRKYRTSKEKKRD